MPIPCKACPLRKKSLFIPFNDEDLSFMESFKTGELTVDAGTPILLEGSNSPQIFTVLSGMGTRYTTLENGKRQVINFIFPGDLAGLQASLLGEMKHSVEATTPMVLCVFKRAELWHLFKSQPGRAYDMTWIAAVEEHFLGETIVTLGQRTASQKIAWALLRIEGRLRAVGLGSGNRIPLPFRQQDLADALGLSLVHTNKTLSQFRERKIVLWTEGQLHILDRPGLAKLALVEVEAEVKRPLF